MSHPWALLSFCTSCASGILTTRVINGIFEAQDTLAQRTIAGQEAKALAPDSRRRWIETLKLDAVAVLLIIAFATAVFTVTSLTRSSRNFPT